MHPTRIKYDLHGFYLHRERQTSSFKNKKIWKDEWKVRLLIFESLIVVKIHDHELIKMHPEKKAFQKHFWMLSNWMFPQREVVIYLSFNLSILTGFPNIFNSFLWKHNHTKFEKRIDKKSKLLRENKKIQI